MIIAEGITLPPLQGNGVEGLILANSDELMKDLLEHRCFFFLLNHFYDCNDIGAGTRKQGLKILLPFDLTEHITGAPNLISSFHLYKLHGESTAKIVFLKN